MAATGSSEPLPTADLRPRVLRASALRRRLGAVDAVDGIDLTVGEGEVVGLIGPNGAGKTTLLHLLAGVLDPSAGLVDLGGMGPPTLSKVRARIGFAPQAAAVYDGLTVSENLRFFGRLFGMKGALLQQGVDEALRVSRLEDRKDQRAGTLSGGMRRRLHVAAATVHAPSLLLLDEPTTGVDSESRAQLVECVRTLRGRGCAVVYASHHLDEIAAVCDRVVVLARGKVTFEGPPGDADLPTLSRGVAP